MILDIRSLSLESKNIIYIVFGKLIYLATRLFPLLKKTEISRCIDKILI